MRELNGATIVFDLDGTLIDTAPDLIAATNHALSDLGLPARADTSLRPWISFGARRMVEEALREAGAPKDANEVDRLLGLFLEHYEHNIAQLSRPFPGAMEAVDVLKGSGARLAICTNKREILSLKLLGELGIASQFDAILGRDTLPICKPHPGHLTAAIARAGGSDAKAVMIGDSGVDVETARAARIPVIGVTFGYTDVPIAELSPDVVLSDYANLIGALRGLLEAAPK